MELTKTKFKQTEVGLIPEDWSVFKLSDVLISISDIDHYMPQTTKIGVPYIMTGDLKQLVSDIDFENVKKISDYDFRKLTRKVRSLKGDIIFARYATVGTITFVDVDYEFTVSYSCVTIKPKPSALYGKFLFYYFKSRAFALEISNNVNANIQANIGIGDLYKMNIPLPPTLTEQKAIATALSDVDELIAKLEKLIEKKKAIKQGAMQALLTPPHKGGKRLEGFSGEWVQKKLGEVARIKTGSRNNQDKNAEGAYPFFVRSQTVERIDSYSHDCEAILVPGEGGIGSIFHYINGKFEVHQRVYKISDFNNDVAGKYVFLQMQFSFGKHAMTNSVKATVDSLRLPTFEEFSFYIPKSIEEQLAISTVLTNMSLEIIRIESKREKINALKQGMMQELLTGRTRLV